MARRYSRPLLEDMRASALEAVAFLGDRTGEALTTDRMRLLALTRAAQIVGEAANGIPSAVQERLTEVDFANAIAMRHRLVHGYGTIDPTILADTVRTDFPPMILALDAALAGDLPDEATS